MKDKHGKHDPGALDPKPSKRQDPLPRKIWDQFKPWMPWVVLGALAFGAVAVAVF